MPPPHLTQSAARYQQVLDIHGVVNPDMIKGIFEGGQEMFIPNDPRNQHWQAFQAWLKEGNEPELPLSIPHISNPAAMQEMITKSEQAQELNHVKILAAQGHTEEALMALINMVEKQS